MSFYVGIAVLFSYFVEGISGFGGMILALPVLSAILGLKTAVALLVVLSTIFDLVLIAKDYKAIALQPLLKITFFTVLFMPLGFLVLKLCSEKLLLITLGIFIIAISIWGLLESFNIVKGPKIAPWQMAFLPLAGIMQGAFGGSGPFIVVYSKRVLKDKTIFRSTMAAVWTVLNMFNLIQYGFLGMLSITILEYVINLFPFLIVGFILGTIVHKKINQIYFTRFAYAILFISGIITAL